MRRRANIPAMVARRLLVSRLLLLGAVLLLIGTALYGITAPFVAGHYGFHGGEYSTRARNTLRHGTFLPANTPGWTDPVPSSYYLHHPILTHHVVTFTFALLGEHTYAVRIAALLGCLATMLALARLVWQRWGPPYGALAAWVFALVPINVWFSPHMDVGYPSMVCLLLCFDRYFPWLERGRPRDAAAALLFAGLSVGFEWSPYLCAIPLGVHSLAVALKRRGRYLAFPPLLVVAMLLPLALHGLLVLKTGHLPEMQESFRSRTRVMEYKAFLSSLYEYVRLLLGPYTLPIHGLWILTLLLRLARGRLLSRDLLSLSFLFALLSYVHIFKLGVLMHPYRLLYGGVVCAIAAADLAQAAGDLWRWLLARSPALTSGSSVCAALVGALVVLSQTPAAATALRQSRAQGGTPTPTPVRHDPVLGRVAFAEAVRAATTPADLVEIHPTFSCRMDLAFHLDRTGRVLPSLAALRFPVGSQAVYYGSYGASQGPHPDRSHAVVALVPRALAADERRALGELLQKHPALEVDGYMMVDLRQAGQGVRVLRLAPAAPRSPLQSYLEGPFPLPRLVPDPRAESAYRAEFKLGSAPTPSR